MKMDDVPDEIDVKGVKGKRIQSYRRYLGKGRIASGWVLRVTYEFDLHELHDVNVAKYYDIPEKFRVRDEVSKEIK